MNNLNKLNGRPAATTGQVPDTAFTPLSTEDARALILRARADSESEVRLAAAINAAAPGSRLQSQEDAFALPSEEPVCQPVGKV
jgi:hypothetical protein